LLNAGRRTETDWHTLMPQLLIYGDDPIYWVKTYIKKKKRKAKKLQ
jgi:hypothetical protein